MPALTKSEAASTSAAVSACAAAVTSCARPSGGLEAKEEEGNSCNATSIPTRIGVGDTRRNQLSLRG
eukprot:4972132-Pleurochrysis_carterae.AAC.1